MEILRESGSVCLFFPFSCHRRLLICIIWRPADRVGGGGHAGNEYFPYFCLLFIRFQLKFLFQVPPSSLGLGSARHPPGEGKKEAISKYGFPVFYYLMGRTFETEMFARWMLTSFYDRFVAFASTAVECYHYADGQVNICLFHHTWRPGSEKSSSRSLIVIIGFRKYWL